MLLDSDNINEPLILQDYSDLIYGTIPNTKKKFAKEIFVGVNEIITEDDIFGLTDSTNVTEFLSFTG
jgi:hypothetical protein